ncbi:MAG: hypothetical protein D6765_05700 [Bacteroidetes bacterium]|nr:MAG: hypothetical protein D6765_05700 [Bacteroidota bacterium]
MQQDLKRIFGDVSGLDEKSAAILTAALDKNNLPGFDYLEFKKSLGALFDLNMDEATAFKSAFATAATMGLSKENLLKSAAHYRRVLESEKAKFDQALKKQLDKRVRSRQEEMVKLQKQVEQWEEQVRQLQEQIRKAKETLQKADALMETEMNKIETTKKNFEATLQTLLKLIEADIEKVERYL